MRTRTDNVNLYCNSRRCIIAAELCKDTSFVQDESGEPYFSTATIFISYFWQASFFELTEAMKRRRSKKAYYWIDILNVAQNRHTDQASRWNQEDVGKFDTAIREANAIVWLHCEYAHCSHASACRARGSSICSRADLQAMDKSLHTSARLVRPFAARPSRTVAVRMHAAGVSTKSVPL